MFDYQVIMCVVNAGFSEVAMDAAREFGARGGTVIHARGTAGDEAEKKFNISVQPEKEIVMILVESELKDAILHALYQKVGLQTSGQGIAFCLPVEDVVGIVPKSAKDVSADASAPAADVSQNTAPAADSAPPATPPVKKD